MCVCAYVWLCTHCVCTGEGTEQGGIKDVVRESLTSKSYTFTEEGRSKAVELAEEEGIARCD